MKVEDLMTRKAFSCRPHETMSQAARIFWEHDCGCVPITDEETRVVGMLTDRDVCIAGYIQGKPLAEIPIRSAMAAPVHSCKPTDTVASAEETMRTHQVRRLPVVDRENRLVGVLSLNDIAREAARERARSKKDVTDLEVAATFATVCKPRLEELVAAHA